MSKVGRRRREEHPLLLVLRQEPARGPEADRRPDGVHLRRMRRALHGHHPRGDEAQPRQVVGRRAHAARDLQGARRLRHRPAGREARALGRRAQPLQAAEPRPEEHRRRAAEVEHHADRPDRLRQDAAGADAGPHPRRALHDGGRDDADRGRLRRRGCREHHPQAAAVGRVQRRAGAARHRLHRRGRQDQPQVGQSLDHPRRVGRGRAAGAPEDHGGHRRLRARRRAGASIRSRSSCRSTPRTSSSSAAAPSPGSTRSSPSAAAARRWASAPR